jgi:cell wall-associated NlpC family hydrolase
MQNNAEIIYDYLISKGWSLNAVSGMLGNMQKESTINPGIWQELIEGSGGGGGFGLVQWTPYTNFTNWADSKGYEWDDGTAQLKWIDEETVSFGQWIPTSTYNFNFSVYKKSTESPEYLASAFLHNFERAGVAAETERRTNARTWYEYLENYSGGSGEPDNNENQQIIENAVEWAVSIANDDAHGYTQDLDKRWGPDYDCSSLLIQAYENAGVPVKTEGASYTGNMESVFTSCGFDSFVYSSNIELIKGDVLLRNGHTAMYIGNGEIVSAHINEFGETTGGQTGDQTGKEINVSSFATSGSWDIVLRLPTNGNIPDNPENPSIKNNSKLSKLLLYAIATDI